MLHRLRPWALLALLLGPLAPAQEATRNVRSLIEADYRCQQVVKGSQDAYLSGDGSGATNERHARRSLSERLRLGGTVGLQFSYAYLDAAGSNATGHHGETSASLTLDAVDRLHWSIVAGATSELDWNAPTDRVTLRNVFLQNALLFDLGDYLAAGPFFLVTETELHSATGSDTTDVHYSAGALGTVAIPLGPTNLGFTGTLASMNKERLAELTDQRDTAVSGMVDLYVPLNDWLAVDPFVYYYALLDRDRNLDDDYWQLGIETSVQLTERWAATVEYATYAANADYREHRVTSSVSWSF